MQALEPSSDRWKQDLLRQALTRKTPPDRAAFLDEACRGDAVMRVEMEAWLAIYEGGEKSPVINEEAGKHPPGEGLTEEIPTVLDETLVTEGPGTVIGRYKLVEQIGEGGFGVVYLAEQREPVRRQVALKIIKLGMDTRQVVARFEAERQALALMDHPNIAKVFDAGATDTGRPFFVMELVKGIPIPQYCDQEKLSTVDRLKLFIAVCQAIQHAHQKGIIHRDIKPSNILVTLQEGTAVPKVIDFGIAKATQQKLTEKTLHTRLEQFIGTPAYMSPEQAEMSGLDIDTRSDIYSLGVLLYELLTGKTPFDSKELLAAGFDEIRRTIREKEPMRPSTRLSTMAKEELTTTTQRRGTEAPKLISLLRGDLDWIVMKCLEKDRTRRYETANGLAMDLQRQLNNEAVIARPPSTAYRFQKLIRRNKLIFAAATAVALSLIAGLGFSTWSFLRERKAHTGELAERRTAEEQRQRAEAHARTAQEQRERAETREVEARRFLYVAQMNLAQQAWEQNNIGRLHQLLEETHASPDRGFEWYYWLQQTHLALKTFRGHAQAVTCVAFSPDSQRIGTGSLDQTAKVWEAASGRELLTLKGHSAEIWSLAFSPDGQRIVTGSGDQTAKVWETVSGRELLTLKGHSAAVWSAAFSPDGQRIVTSGLDQTAKVWEAASGRELLTLKGHIANISSVAFSADGQRIVTGSLDHTAKVWEAASGRELFTFTGHSNWITSVAFSPDCQRVVTGGVDAVHKGVAKVWEAVSGRELLTLKGHSAQISSVAFSADGLRIVTGSLDQTAKVWEVASGRELLTLKGHSDQIWSVAISPDGREIATGSLDQTVKVWEASTNKEVPAPMGHSAAIRSVAFSPDGGQIVTGSLDETAKVWETASGRELLTLRGHSAGIRSVAFSPDGQRIVTGSLDQTAKVWEAASGRELLTLKGHNGWIWCAAFSPDGKRVVTGSFDRTAKLWEASSGRELLALKAHNGGVSSLAFSPDCQRIVTGSLDETAKVWEAASGRELLTLKGHSAAVWSAAFSPDGQRIVTGGLDQTAKVWETASGRELLTLKGHSAAVWSVAFSPDGQRIVTGGLDQTAKVWETGSGRELLTLKGHSGAIRSVAFSPDGQRVVSGSDDQTAKVWEAARVSLVASWQEEERAANQRLTGLKREWTIERERQRRAGAGDDGAIKQWLILAPIALKEGQDVVEGLDIEQVEGEARLLPRAGETKSIGNVELKWQEVVLEDYRFDLNVIMGQITTRSVAYVVCYVRSDGEQRDLQLLVGSDDAAKIYVNGRQIYKASLLRPFVAEQDKVPITLKAGLNALVFKLVNDYDDWQGSIRVTDAKGNPVNGIKVTLDPQAKD